MTRTAKAFAATLALALILAWPAEALAAGSARASKSLGRWWLTRLDPSFRIPDDFAIRFGNAALSVGLTKGQAAAMLNDPRFSLAVGAPDTGYGLLEAMIKDPEKILQAQTLLKNHDLSAWGSDSVQTALIDVAPALRNAYLADFGLMAVRGPNDVLVLVDIETGRQYIGQGHLGTQLRAPGGGPLPELTLPQPSPGIDTQAQAEAQGSIAAATGPGFNFTSNGSPGLGLAPATGESNDHVLLTPGIYLVGLMFVLAWGGYAVIAVIRRIRS